MVSLPGEFETFLTKAALASAVEKTKLKEKK